MEPTEISRKEPWYVRRSREFDPYKSKHAGGDRLRKPGRKSKEGRVARARVNNWPRGRS